MKILTKDADVRDITDFKEVKSKSKLRFVIFEDLFDYSITEFGSGIRVAKGDTKKEAIENLNLRLKEYGDEYIIKQAKKLVKENGFKYPINK